MKMIFQIYFNVIHVNKYTVKVIILITINVSWIFNKEEIILTINYFINQ